MVTALYIDPRGPYPKLCDSWDEKRDARTFNGPGPVVAHPPCGPWGGLRHLYEGAEHDCGPRAVEQVRQFGGVLEHPARSKLWEACELPPPVPGRVPDHSWEWDPWCGFSIEVDQVEWGHVARKRTWLYIVGASHEDVSELLAKRPYPGREPTHWVSGRRATQDGVAKARARPGGRVGLRRRESRSVRRTSAGARLLHSPNG